MGVTPEALKHFIGLSGTHLIGINELVLDLARGNNAGGDLFLKNRGRLFHHLGGGVCESLEDRW